MNISELTQDQLAGLLGLLKAVVMADGIVSPAEQNILEKIVQAVGEDTYRTAFEGADERFANLDTLKDFLTRIEDQGAREVIYFTVWEEAVASPSTNHEESELLAWLADLWSIRT
jgi:hypothetical protein